MAELLIYIYTTCTNFMVSIIQYNYDGFDSRIVILEIGITLDSCQILLA